MANYKWVEFDYTFDKSTPIYAIRYDSVPVITCPPGPRNMFLSEVTGINCDGMLWRNTTGVTNGYAGDNRFSPYTNFFSNRYWGVSDVYFSAGTHTTYVSGTTYQYDFPVSPLYYAGCDSASTASETVSIQRQKMQVMVDSKISPSEDDVVFNYSQSSHTITLSDIEEGTTWSASTVNDWISVNPISGTSSDTNVTITAASYIFGTTERSGSVTITDSDENTAEVTVTQKPNTAFPNNNLYLGVNRIN